MRAALRAAAGGPLLLLLLALAPRGAFASGGPATWPCTWTSFPRGTPSPAWPDGPIVGNGNMGLAVGGAPGEIAIYGTVHGFWSNSVGANSTMPPLARRRSVAAPIAAPGSAPVAAPGSAPGSSFPECPGATCNITVGLTLLRLLVSSPQLAASWAASLDLARAAATVSLGGAGGAALEATLWASATSQVAVLTLANVGSVAIGALNVTVAANNNVQGVPTTAGCADAATGAPAACPAPPALAALAVTKDANTAAARSSLPITAAALVSPVASSGAAAASAQAQPFTTTEPHTAWANGATVNTVTNGTSQLLSLAPGASVTYVLSMAASRDPGVLGVFASPAEAVSARVGAVTAADLAPLRAAHEAWWAAFWARSSVSLGGEEATEAFWFSSLYALGSGTRAGQLVMDLWSPWRTTDYSEWRSNPTMDYNQQVWL